MFTQGRIRVIALGLADLVCIYAVWTAVVLGFQQVWMWMLPSFSYGPEGAWIYLDLWPVGLLFVFFNAIFDTYHGSWMYPSAPHPPVEEMRRLVASAFLTHIAVVAFIAMARSTTEGYSRLVVAISGLLVALGAQGVRNAMRALLAKTGVGQIPVVLAGGGVAAHHVAAALDGDTYVGFTIVGYFAGTNAARVGRRRRRREWDERELNACGVRYLGTLREIVPWAKARDIKILLACQDERLFRQQLDEFASWFTYIDYLPTARAFPVFGSRAISFDGVGGLEMINQGRMRAKRFQKRVLDAALALLAALAMLPLFILIAVLVKLTSRGPVFFRQERLGRNGHPIRVWKFRSMYADAEARLARLLASDPKLAEEWRRNFKLADDPRVTSFGRFLRKTSLDELPQLFNVLAGDMALIGPRPIVEDEVKYYGDAYKVFSSVRPGVTGLWQVSGRSDTDYARRVALDTLYVLNWSPWMDIWILVRTIYAVLLMRGAR